MQTSRALTLALLGLTALACETTVVPPGETVTFDQNSLFIGASGNDEGVGPQSAVDFGPDAQVTLAGAVLLGGAFVGPSQLGVGTAGAGIRGSRGTLIVTGGTIQGGAVSVPQGTSIRGRSGAGVQTWRSTVTIAGGQLRGGAAPIGVIPASGLEGLMSTVHIRGGTIDQGHFNQSRVIVTGGDIGRLIADTIIFSQTEVLPDGTTETRTALLGSCAEIRGGKVPRIGVAVGSDLFVVGSRFNLPFGEVQTLEVQLVGELADGSPIDARLNSGGRTVLLQTPAPGSPQAVPGSLCPASVLDVPELFPEIKRPPPPPPGDPSDP